MEPGKNFPGAFAGRFFLVLGAIAILIDARIAHSPLSTVVGAVCRTSGRYR